MHASSYECSAPKYILKRKITVFRKEEPVGPHSPEFICISCQLLSQLIPGKPDVTPFQVKRECLYAMISRIVADFNIKQNSYIPVPSY